MPDEEPTDNLEPAAEPTAQPAADEVNTESSDQGVSEVEELRQSLEQAIARADANWEKLVRVQAEQENQRKRSERDLEHAHKFALEKFAAELLAVKDSLELGLNAAEGEKPDAEKLHEGTELTLRMLAQAMEKFNIVTIDPQGEPFNPELHQAMTTQEDAGLKPNTVVSVIQKGYTLNARLLRPAMVIVSKAPTQGDGEGDGEGEEAS